MPSFNFSCNRQLNFDSPYQRNEISQSVRKTLHIFSLMHVTILIDWMIGPPFPLTKHHILPPTSKNSFWFTSKNVAKITQNEGFTIVQSAFLATVARALREKWPNINSTLVYHDRSLQKLYHRPTQPDNLDRVLQGLVYRMQVQHFLTFKVLWSTIFYIFKYFQAQYLTFFCTLKDNFWHFLYFEAQFLTFLVL